MLAGDINIIDLSDFISLDSAVCKTFDVITGESISFPVQGWFKEKRHRQYALVLHGDSNLGKTQLALSVASEIALEQQRKANLPLTSSRSVRLMHCAKPSTATSWLRTSPSCSTSALWEE